MVKIETLTIPERERILLFIKRISKFLLDFILLFLTKLWYAFNKLTLEGVVILNFLAIFLLAESKSAKVLISAFNKYLIACSNFSMDKKYAQYLLDKTKNDYNLIAEDFSRTRTQVWQELSSLFSDLKQGEKVLDLGCGNARYYQLFKEKGVDYTGIDTSEKLIKIAQEKYKRAKLFSVDALNLPFKDNSFDKIYSIAVLHHIPSRNFRLEFLKKAKRVLKPKGKLILTVWKLQGKKEVSLLIKYTILKIIGKNKMDFRDILEPWADKTNRYYHLFSKRELIKLVKQSGFKIIKSAIIKNQTGNRKNIYLIAQK